MSAPSPLVASQHAARALRDRGDLAGARTVLRRALESSGAAAAHPEVIETARMLAALHREMGDLAAARRTLEEAIAAGQLSFGEDHPLMLILAYDLGIVAHEFGNRHEARRNLGAVAELGPAALGPDHPAVWAATRYLDQEVPPPPQPPEPPQPPVPPRAAEPHSFLLDQRQPAPPRRTLMIIVAAATAAAAATAVTAAVIVLRPDAPPATTPGPATSTASTRPAPTGLTLRDEGTAITLTWRDPSAGTAPFIVAGARAGEQSRPFANLPAGRTTYTVSGLNPRLQYCFTVVAVYSADELKPSDLVCTRRNPQPSRS